MNKMSSYTSTELLVELVRRHGYNDSPRRITYRNTWYETQVSVGSSQPVFIRYSGSVLNELRKE